MADKGIIEQHAAPALAVEPTRPRVAPAPLEYPDSDGRFLPENPLHASAIVEFRNSLQQHFRHRRNVVLEGDMFLYYAEGQADKRRVLGKKVGKFVAPDVIVVLDHDLGDRLVYKLWVEGKPPDFAMEVISPSSEARNRKKKRDLYARIGIGEYFVFQPDARRAGPRLVGYELGEWGYRRLGPEAGVPGSVRSPVLGVSLRPEGAFLRVRDKGSGTDYLWNVELMEAKEAEAAGRQAAEARAQEIDRQLQESEAARRAEKAGRQAEKAGRQAEKVARRAAEARAQEKDRLLRRAQEEIARLKAYGRHSGRGR